MFGINSQPNDYYDPFRCHVPLPDGRCHIRNGGVRCVHLSIECLQDNEGYPKYRYVCAKGCFDYVSQVKLHE